MRKTNRTSYLAALTAVAVAATLVAADPIGSQATEQLTTPTATDRDGDRVVDTLASVAEAAPEAEVRVIVELEPGADPTVVAEATEAPDEALHLDIVDSVAVEVPAGDLDELARLPGVRRIQPDREVVAFNLEANEVTGAGVARIQAGVEGDLDGNPGAYGPGDVVVAVVDTGIDARHRDLDGGKVIGWLDVLNARSTPYDDHGHGTHVAGTIAGTGEGSGVLTGIAPGAALVGIKALDHNGRGFESWVVAGIDWAVANRAALGIEIVNLSLGFPGCSDGKDPVSVAVDRAVAAGLTVVAAAGNEGPGRCTVGAPGAAARAITVGALEVQTGTGGMSGVFYGSRGPTADGRIKPDVVAPGNVLSAYYETSGGDPSAYRERVGTSMAAAVVSGVAALMIDRSPGLTPAQIADVLRSTARDWGAPGPDHDYGWGMVNAHAAVSAVGSPIGPAPAHPAHGAIRGTLGAGGRLSIPVQVTTGGVPLGVTLHHGYQPGAATTPDLDVTLRAQNGTVLGSAATNLRVEALIATNVPAGTHTIEIVARNAASSFVLDVSGAIVVPAPPAAPAVSVAPGQGRLTVKWNPPPGGAVAYTISSEQLGLTTTVPGSQRSSTFTGLRNGRRHDFRVVAHTLGGASPAGTASATPTTYHPFATPEAFVDRQYRDFLLRAPDPAGRQYWSSLLRSGVTGTQIVSAFLSSPEYEGRVASLVRLYYAYFLRAPDTSGLQFWLDQRVRGQSLYWVAGFFAESPEFRTRYGRLNDVEFVRLVYRNVLNRDPDLLGALFWIDQLQSKGRSRGEVMLAFSESPEFVRKSAGRVDTTLVWFGMLRAVPSKSDYGYWSAALSSGTDRAALVDALLHDSRYARRAG